MSKCLKNWRSRTTFGSWGVEKVYEVVARSTIRSKHVKSTACSNTFGLSRHDNSNSNSNSSNSNNTTTTNNNNHNNHNQQQQQQQQQEQVQVQLH